jgi:hypothetical protein
MDGKGAMPSNHIENDKIRRQRNVALAAALVAFAVLFFAVTIVRLGGNVAQRAAFPQLDRYENVEDSTR